MLTEAVDAQEHRRIKSIAERAELLRSMAKVLRARKASLAKMIDGLPLSGPI